MTDRFKNASDWLNNCTDAFFSDLSIKATLREALKLATESEQLHEKLADERMENIKQFALMEQLRKERDELQKRFDELDEKYLNLRMSDRRY